MNSTSERINWDAHWLYSMRIILKSRNGIGIQSALSGFKHTLFWIRNMKLEMDSGRIKWDTGHTRSESHEWYSTHELEFTTHYPDSKHIIWIQDTILGKHWDSGHISWFKGTLFWIGYIAHYIWIQWKSVGFRTHELEFKTHYFDSRHII